MTIKSDNHALKALAEEVAAEGVRHEGPRVQDGTSYFHGIWNDSQFASKPLIYSNYLDKDLTND